MKPRHTSSFRPTLRPLALSLICAGMGPALAQTLPQGFSTPNPATVSMQQSGALMTINQSQARGIANWTSFSIGLGGKVQVNQPTAQSILLNRVSGNEPSVIAGQLSANGRIVLLNPNGVMFSAGSSVNVGGLIASTLAMKTSDSDFLNGNTQLSFQRDDTNKATVSNSGSITANRGPVVLMGATVANSGTITADGGNIALASGRAITIDLVGDNLTNIIVTPEAMASHASVSNTGTLQADGGRVSMTGASATVGELVVNQSGTVRARSMGMVNGQIVLGGGANNRVEVNGGTLDATGANAGERGGSIAIGAGQVQLRAGDAGSKAVLDASGQAGGGSIGVGGGNVGLSSATVLRADATGNGAGGTIDVSAAVVPGAPDEASSLQAFGEMTARGAGSGAGGRITTAGDFVRINPTLVDAGGGAQGGANGSWNLSSGNITVAQGSSVGAYDPAYPSLSSSRVGAEAIGGALGRNTDVTLSSKTTGDAAGVVFADGAQVVKDAGGTATLRVNSAGSIDMGSGSAIDARTGVLNVDFNVDSTGLVAANVAKISTSGGDNPVVEADYAGSISLNNATINANGGNIRFFGQGDAANGHAVGGSVSHPLDGGPDFRDGVSLTDSTLNTGGAGLVSLRGQGRSYVNANDGQGNVYVASNGVGMQGSTVQAGSGGVQVDGLAAFGGSAVVIGNGSEIATPGNVSITGKGAVWSDDTQPTGNIDATTAVRIDSASVRAGGNVLIDGTGARLDGLRTNSDFASSNRTAGGANGVAIAGLVQAGDGQRIDVRGQAGSGGFSATQFSGGPITVIDDNGQLYGVTVDANAAQPTALVAAGGTIAIDARGTDIALRSNDGGLFEPELRVASIAPAAGGLVSVASASGKGGGISLTGRNVLIDGTPGIEGGDPVVAKLDASGATGGGSIDVRATGVIALGANAVLNADATGSGNGGIVDVVAGDTLRAYGSLSALGGASGGNGGAIETSAPHFDLTGVRADASAPLGIAGTWTIDPYNVTIVNGTATGSLSANPFVALATSVIQDGDINAALDKGSSVSISTGTGGLATDGNITFGTGASIVRTVGGAPLTFQLDAAHNINGTGTSIRSNDGALNVVFNAGTGGQQGSINFNGTINTNGGNVAMTAALGTTNGTALSLPDTTIDTRVTALGDGGPSGTVQLTGSRGTPTFITPNSTVVLNGTQILSSTGDVTIRGTGVVGEGVVIGAGAARGLIRTTSGDISIVGIGSGYDYSGFPVSVQSVQIGNATVQSTDGDIAIRGLSTPGSLPAVSGGVLVANSGLVTTLGVGNIDIAGESQRNGPGVTIGTAGTGGTIGTVSGNNNVVLRAANDGSADALAINNGSVRAANVLNLRPGGVDAAGNAVDRTANPITLGGTAATGFAVSAAEFTRLSAATIVAGSNTQAADINVVGPLVVPQALTLQNGGGGNIQLDGAVSATTLGLVSAGNIGQSAAAPITAGALLARSSGGNVVLDNAGNDVGTVSGGAAGRFAYVDANALSIAPVSVTGFDAGANLPQVLSSPSMAADTVFVRTLSGDLTLGQAVTSGSGTDLVAAARFQNAGLGSIAGAGWRVWADTWVGESRGGLAGSYPLPNLYHCAYLGLCTVSVPTGGNHFIYAQQPEATVFINNATRAGGLPNPMFTYSITGLILGDLGAGFFGYVNSLAGLGSPPGFYPINGSFTSAEGYAVRVVPGQLLVGPFTQLPKPDTLRDLPTSWLYDRNIGQAPICLATGPLEGDRASQGGDILAREWSRVRSRPNLTSCVDTEKRNGCSDF